MKLKYLLALSFFIFIFSLTYIMGNQNYEIVQTPEKTELSDDIKQEIIKQKEIKESLETENEENSGVVLKEVIEKIDSNTGTINELEVNNEEISAENGYILINKQPYTVEKLNYISNIDNLLKFSGGELEKIEKIKIGTFSYTPNIIDGYLFVLVEESRQYDGEYDVIFILKDGTEIVLNEKINFSFSNDIFLVSNITPQNLKNDIARNIVLQGEGFRKTISIQLSNNIVLKPTSFNIINDNVLIIKIPEGLDLGKYSLNIMGTEGIFTPNIQITISE